MNNKGIDSIIDNHFGKRVKQAKYSYSDIILSWVYANLCGAERLEDVMLMKEHLSSIPYYKCPSSDRLSQVLRNKSEAITEIDGNLTETHCFSIDTKLNKLMLDIAKKLNVIDGNILDYDNVIIPTNKYDASWTYKKIKGYQPGVSFINKTPVYIEGRGGNSNAVFKMKETLERSLNLLKEKQIPVKYFRSDSAAYQKYVVELMNKNNIEFFIRVIKNNTLLDEIRYNMDNWETFNIGNQKIDVGEGTFIPFVNLRTKKKQKAYRIVVTRIKINGEYIYRAIMTTNTSMSKEKVVDFYNKRGAIERNFDDLKNNFNWSRLPFSVLNENTTFLIISAIVSIIYQYIVNLFSKKLDFVKHTFRLKNFIYHFITVSSMWNKGKLKIFSQKSYEVLLE